MLKAPKEECSNHTRSIVHRCFGKLYALQGRTDEALTHLASNVYYCARETGGNSVDCADGYFLLAQVLPALRRRARVSAAAAGVFT